MAGIQVGVAEVVCTPKAGLPLLGNYRDDYAARGVHDPLMAKAIVFADTAGNKAARLVVDVCLLDRDNVAVMRRTIGSQCDVPPASVIIGGTHTHSGPATSGRLRFGLDMAPFQSDVEAFLAKAASAVAVADENLAKASLSVGYAGEDRISFNRRLKRKDGSTQMNWEALLPGFDPHQIERAWGPIDPRIIVLTVQQGGRPTAAVVNFGLHPAILAGDNWLYSADFPGYTAEAMRRMLGDDFTCLFFNGCCGNVNHIDYRDLQQGRGYQQTQRVGYMLAAGACQAMAVGKPVEADRVAASSEKVVLERMKISDQQRQWCDRVLEEARANPPKGQVDGLPDAYYAETLLEMHRKQHEPDEVEVTAIRVGEVALVGLPGEAFCELGMEIKQRSPAGHTIVSELCNDAIGYIPTRESFPQGGYESTPGSTFYAQGADGRLVDSAVGQLNRLFSE